MSFKARLELAEEALKRGEGEEAVRFAIIGATAQQVKDAGGLGIKEARAAGMVFAVLSESQADQLRSQGCIVNRVEKVRADVMPPAPVIGVPTYSPEQLVWAAGLD